jgi:hypothetical protein
MASMCIGVGIGFSGMMWWLEDEPAPIRPRACAPVEDTIDILKQSYEKVIKMNSGEIRDYVDAANAIRRHTGSWPEILDPGLETASAAILYEDASQGVWRWLYRTSRDCVWHHWALHSWRHEWIMKEFKQAGKT